MSIDWSNVREAMGDDEPIVKPQQPADPSEFWADDAAAAASRDEQRQFEERTGMRSPPRRPAQTAEVLCQSCKKPVSKYAVLCPACGGSVHDRTGKTPMLAICLSAVVAGLAWFVISYFESDAMKDVPTNDQILEMNQQLQRTSKLLDAIEKDVQNSSK